MGMLASVRGGDGGMGIAAAGERARSGRRRRRVSFLPEIPTEISR